jgi:hypothetical protein
MLCGDPQELFRGEGRIEVGELVFEVGAAFKERFDANSPKFLIISGRIGIEEIGLAAFHPFVNGAGNSRKINKSIMKGGVAAFVGGEIYMRERMCHLMEADVLAVGVIGEFAHEVSP